MRTTTTGDSVMDDAIVISDLHLGSENCRAWELVAFLEEIRAGVHRAPKLILNGDVFDSIDFRRLKKSHWKVLSLLRKLSDDMDIIWIVGNHDGSAEVISHLLGLQVVDEYILETGGGRVLFLHGHQFDKFITRHPVATWLADRVYRILQKLDRSHQIAKTAKRRSKVFLRCLEKIEHGALELARRLGCEAVCCGHTHVATARVTGTVSYYNSGCWTEQPCTFLTVSAGQVEVREWLSDHGDRFLQDANSLAASTAK
jgi:UDP-2,3-diacylglucosamine pyrophosphatase LpxH